MRDAIGDALRLIPEAVIVRDTLVAAIRDGALLERRHSDWRNGHITGQAQFLTVVAPLINKDAIRASPERFLGPSATAEGVAVKHTSGTTGRPLPILYDALTLIEQMVMLPRRIAELSSPLATRENGFRPMVTISVTENSAAHEEIWVDPWGGLVAQIVVHEADPTTFRRLVNLTMALRPDLVAIKPTLLDALLDDPMDPKKFAGYVDLFAVSGSDFDTAARTLAELRLGAPVVEAYGLTEFGLVASECDARDGLHIDPSIFPEIFDAPSGAVLPPEAFNPQEGELVLSSSRNTAFPLVRYRTGDNGTLLRAPCACGRKTPRLRSLNGRLVENFRLTDGGVVSPARFNRLFDSHPIAEFQLSQTAPDKFVLMVEPQNGAMLNEVSIASDVRALIGQAAHLKISVGKIERRGKFQRFRIAGV